MACRALASGTPWTSHRGDRRTRTLAGGVSAVRSAPRARHPRGADGGGVRGAGGAAARQLPVLPSPLRRADAQAAAPGGGRRATLAAMLVNPNNHALDGGPATAKMEREVVARAGRDVRLRRRAPRAPHDERHDREPRGAVRRARAAPGQAASPSAPRATTRTRACASVLGVAGARRPGRRRAGGWTSTRSTDLLATGRRRHGGATAGTTGLGAVDPVHEVLGAAGRVRRAVHVDAAYGGFFTLLGAARTRSRREPWQAIARCDSVVVDPHKHGLQPYGCGAVLFARPGGGALLPARLAVHVLHLRRAAPRRDQPRVLARRAPRPPRCG